MVSKRAGPVLKMGRLPAAARRRADLLPGIVATHGEIRGHPSAIFSAGFGIFFCGLPDFPPSADDIWIGRAGGQPPADAPAP